MLKIPRIMNSTPTGIITADYNGVELITTQRQSFAVAEEHDVQAVMARMEANEVVTDGELEELQRLCGRKRNTEPSRYVDSLRKQRKR